MTDPDDLLTELARVRQLWSAEMQRADRAEHERDEARVECDRLRAELAAAREEHP